MNHSAIQGFGFVFCFRSMIHFAVMNISSINGVRFFYWCQVVEKNNSKHLDLLKIDFVCNSGIWHLRFTIATSTPMHYM